ncbi:MAG: oxidoreductase [Candidatus Bathyarchaeota archaeon]|nr:oxidoreductase [Candidatus Bathyarchaeum tardum]WGM90219.1 MAG: oxidoreductase [Candidatus Bathyarchaeum tardum]WNZ29695.1 MAG: oxidoreductase [Candidatus Bathyarchaeota archaeon]
MAKEKLKIAFYWAASCGGCEVAVLDVNEKILDVVAAADIVFWPVAIDTKYKDVEAMPDQSIDACFFNGAIRNSENEKMAKLLRQKSKILVAFGSCANDGCVKSLANLSDKDGVFERAYLETQSTVNPESVTPQTRFKVNEGELDLPEVYDTVKTLPQTVDVDYTISGCPPPVPSILVMFNAFITGDLPPKGSSFLPNKAVCDECPREKKHSEITEFKRIYEIEDDGVTCFLDQGVICMGMATRAGCGCQCPNVNIPCTGCGGPGPRVVDQGAAAISALASLAKDINVVKEIVDPVGTFYKYSLANSILKRKVQK